MYADAMRGSPPHEKCPKCDQPLTAPLGGRCPECGCELLTRVAITEPSAQVVPFLLVAIALSASEGLQRWVLYGAHLGQLFDGRLARLPWYYLLLDASLELSPLALVIALVYRRPLRRAPVRITAACAIVGVAPFVLDMLSLVR